MCLNWKVLLGIGAVILFAYIFLPQIAQYSWILFLLVCPLSMIFMMKAMNHSMGNMNHGSNNTEKLFICPECNFSYKEAEWANKCAAWCKEHHSCNVEIIKHAAE